MPITYDSLTSDKVAFLQGTQAQLNLYLPVSTDETKRGTAIEGAFYLTTYTHRLYIGRKVTAINNNEPNLSNADINKVFPVQVSAGITTVADAGELANVSTNGEKGDMYYIQDGNVLAVLEIDASGNRSWVQVNPPTGIERYTNGLSQIDATHVRFTSTIATQAQQNGTKTSVINYIAGQNITLTAAAGTPGDGTNGVPPSLTIDGTAYSAKTTATAQDSMVVLLDQLKILILHQIQVLLLVVMKPRLTVLILLLQQQIMLDILLYKVQDLHQFRLKITHLKDLI